MDDQVVGEIVSNVRCNEPRELRESVAPRVTRASRELESFREPALDHMSFSIDDDRVTGEVIDDDDDNGDFRDMLQQENVTGKNVNCEVNIMPARNPQGDQIFRDRPRTNRRAPPPADPFPSPSPSPSPNPRKCETFKNVKICDELNVKGGVTFKDSSFSFKSGQRVTAIRTPSGGVNDLPMLCCLFNNINEAETTGSETPGVVLPRVCCGDDGRVIYITNTSPEIVTVFANTCKPNFICNNKTSITLFPCNDEGSLPSSTMLRVECGNWVPYS